MRADGWDRERILALPDVDLGYWQSSRARRSTRCSTRPTFGRAQRLLDVGSNTCWASNLFARRGLDVIALDIATTQMQGLRTADWFLETGEVYFERLLSVMYDPAVASESMDFVFCCEVLHHNDRANLRRTLRELLPGAAPRRAAHRRQRAAALPPAPEARPRRRGRGVRGQRARLLRPQLRTSPRARRASRSRRRGCAACRDRHPRRARWSHPRRAPGGTSRRRSARATPGRGVIAVDPRRPLRRGATCLVGDRALCPGLSDHAGAHDSIRCRVPWGGAHAHRASALGATARCHAGRRRPRRVPRLGARRRRRAGPRRRPRARADRRRRRRARGARRRAGRRRLRLRPRRRRAARPRARATSPRACAGRRGSSTRAPSRGPTRTSRRGRCTSRSSTSCTSGRSRPLARSTPRSSTCPSSRGSGSRRSRSCRSRSSPATTAGATTACT